MPKPVGILVVSLVGCVLLAALALLGFRLVRSGSLPNVIVAHADVGALDESELRSAIEELEGDRRENEITLHRAATRIAPAASTEVTAEELGYEIDVDATMDRVLAHGRQANPIEALWDHLRASFGTIAVEPVDDPSDRGRLEEVARELSAPPFDGGVAFSGKTVEPRYPEPGVLVSVSDLVEPVLGAIRRPGGDSITIRGRPAQPTTDEADVDELVETAERAVDGAVELTLGARSLTFTPEDIGRAIMSVTTETGDELMLQVRAKAVREKLEGVDPLESPPVDARFETSGDSVSVVPARPGFTFVPKVTARQLLTVALKKGASEASLKGKKEPAEFTTADAKALDIEERVSTFTTFHSCL